MSVPEDQITNVTQWQTAQTLLAHTVATVVMVLQEMEEIVQVWNIFKISTTSENARIFALNIAKIAQRIIRYSAFEQVPNNNYIVYHSHEKPIWFELLPQNIPFTACPSFSPKS